MKKAPSAKLMSLLLCFSICIISALPEISVSAAEENMTDDIFPTEYYKIMEEYYLQANYTEGKDIETFQYETVNKLNQMGYQSFAVTPASYYNVEKTLQTDLKSLGVQRTDHCIIFLSPAPLTSSTGSTFSYAYNGTTYTMRTLTVTASDNSSYGQSSMVNILSSKTRSVILNCLNAAITTAAGSISSSLGTVATICGLAIENFSFTQTATMYLNGSSSWTRSFTQVYNSTYQSWYNGSCTEYVCQYSKMSGSYYSSTLNRYTSVPEDASIVYTNASHYGDTSWRKLNAVMGYLGSTTIYDLTGSVKFYYNGTCRITHSENF